MVLRPKQDMTKTQPLLSFTIDEPYDVALRMVRIALTRQGLRAPAELDITARIRQELGAGVAPCIVLYVDDPAVLLEAVVFNRGAALFIPQPLVVTGDNRQAEVLLRSAEMPDEAIPETVRDPLIGVQVRMTRAIESIAERQGAHMAISSLNSESPQRRLLGDLRTPSREMASRTLCPVASVLFYADHEDRGSKYGGFQCCNREDRDDSHAQRTGHRLRSARCWVHQRADARRLGCRLCHSSGTRRGAGWLARWVAAMPRSPRAPFSPFRRTSPSRPGVSTAWRCCCWRASQRRRQAVSGDYSITTGKLRINSAAFMKRCRRTSKA